MRAQYLLVMAAACLSGCDGDHEELQQWMAQQQREIKSDECHHRQQRIAHDVVHEHTAR